MMRFLMDDDETLPRLDGKFLAIRRRRGGLSDSVEFGPEDVLREVPAREFLKELKSRRDPDRPVRASVVSDLCVKAFDREFLTGLHCFWTYQTADGGLVIQHST